MILFKKSILSFFMLFLSFTASSTAQSMRQFFDQADTFLAAHVKNGQVDYQGIREKPAKLNDLVQSIKTMSLAEATADQKEAFYINAYNLLVIHSIIEHGIPSSPQKIDGFFDKIQHSIAGKKLTLDAIETDQLRHVYHDSRLHFALVCGAVSCPPIRPFAYKPNRLDERLTKVTRTTLNSDFIRLNKEQKKAAISEIFKWYKQDFLKENESVRTFINTYRKQKIPADFGIDYYDYNWQLNSQ